MLLLDELTFVGEGGQRLADDVRYAISQHKQIVLVHSSEGEEGGCAFDHFFSTTPSDLVAAGLYSERIAIAWLRCPGYNQVSIALIAKALGARSRKLSIQEYCRRSAGDGATSSNSPNRIRKGSMRRGSDTIRSSIVGASFWPDIVSLIGLRPPSPNMTKKVSFEVGDGSSAHQPTGLALARLDGSADAGELIASQI